MTSSDYEPASPLLQGILEDVRHLPGFYGVQEESDERGTYIDVVLHSSFEASMDVLRERFPHVRFVVDLVDELQCEQSPTASTAPTARAPRR